MNRNTYLKLTGLEEARALLFERCASAKTGPLGTECIPLEQALGRTLARAATAGVSSPAFHGAAMDGIAVVAENTFGASERRPKELRLGQEAHWINTGRILPPGCNAVIMVENVISGPDRDYVSIEKAAFPWQNVRKLGEDMVATEILLAPGVLIGPYELGALAAAGVLRPEVFIRPRVAILPSGSELITLHEASPELLAAGEKLPEFNSLMLAALVREAGGEPQVMPIVPDDAAKIAEALRSAAQSDADLIVINAGSSAGSKDYTAAVIAELGELWLHGVAMMPGKPTAFGGIPGKDGRLKPVLGIPGYPVSAMLSFEQFGQPLLALWQKRSMPERPLELAVACQALPSRPGMEEFLRVKLGRVDEKLIAVPLPRGAGTVSSLSRADGIIRIPAQSEGFGAGATVPVRLIRGRDQIEKSLLIIGSHDNTLDLLDSFLRTRRPGHSLTSAHVGSLGGIMALKNGNCHLAGSHLLGADGLYNREAIAIHLRKQDNTEGARDAYGGMPVHLVRLADREQGLILSPGNPKKITSLADLQKPGVTFINRQRGSGTRVLLDSRLKELGINSDSIAGYEDEEYTHMNVAAAVLSGRATAGLGVKAAAQALGLDFVPVGVEEYDLLIPDRFFNDLRVQALLETIRSAEFKAAVFALGGYGIERTGDLVWSFAG
ncbi:MAG: molybdopterin biosynthesis protein [Deltaproteobacteria bacterium]|nr:molybdopterin biosynthesis protein [Deltaproteobacteria bacterium]